MLDIPSLTVSKRFLTQSDIPTIFDGVNIRWTTVLYQPRHNQHLSCRVWRQIVSWVGADVWHLTSASRPAWRQTIFFLFYGSHFFGGGGKWKTKHFPSEIRATRSPRRHSTWPPYTLVRYTVKTDTTDIHAVVSEWLKAIHQGMQVVCKTQEARHERLEKRSCEIELRGAHLKLVYYNCKQVLLCVQYATCHCSRACEERRRTRWYIYIYAEVIYTDIHTYIYIYTYLYVYINTYTYIHTAKISFNILARYL